MIALIVLKKKCFSLSNCFALLSGKAIVLEEGLSLSNVAGVIMFQENV